MEQCNLNYIKNLSGGDLEFEQKIIEIIKKEFPEEVKVYENAIETSDFKATAEIVHKIKHKISILGLEKSYELAVDYEKDLLNEGLSYKEEFEKLLEHMTLFVQKL